MKACLATTEMASAGCDQAIFISFSGAQSQDIKILAKYFEPLPMHRASFSNSFFFLQHPDADSLYIEEIDVGEESMCCSKNYKVGYVHSNNCLTT